MQILMLETRRGSADGFVVRRFDAGMNYDLPDTLAKAFIIKGWATEDNNTDYFHTAG